MAGKIAWSVLDMWNFKLIKKVDLIINFHTILERRHYRSTKWWRGKRKQISTSYKNDGYLLSKLLKYEAADSDPLGLSNSSCQHPKGEKYYATGYPRCAQLTVDVALKTNEENSKKAFANSLNPIWPKISMVPIPHLVECHLVCLFGRHRATKSWQTSYEYLSDQG